MGKPRLSGTENYGTGRKLGVRLRAQRGSIFFLQMTYRSGTSEAGRAHAGVVELCVLELRLERRQLERRQLERSRLERFLQQRMGRRWLLLAPVTVSDRGQRFAGSGLGLAGCFAALQCASRCEFGCGAQGIMWGACPLTLCVRVIGCGRIWRIGQLGFVTWDWHSGTFAGGYGYRWSIFRLAGRLRHAPIQIYFVWPRERRCLPRVS